VVAGTGPINPDLSGLTVPTGVPTSAGVSIAVLSNIPTGTGTAPIATGISCGAGLLTVGSNIQPVVTVLATVTAGNNGASRSLAAERFRPEMSLWGIIGAITIALAAIA